ncbi:hypothetical protein [Snodgrassella alvi]|jgi:hypothetical protein|uniref:Uncharacterized protein n=1 Tax=Snodgrassella alvi TaxID=1196083 RepID=A0A855G913_9NEIS|nr:hypothetical protein [Snodgrassella alvi]PIT45898.1 hypothetical protein BHC51_07995 [Snodgrassella alvi]PIT60619.1 hypothetical protein BHC57_03415 [Snodgrassella alvi]
MNMEITGNSDDGWHGWDIWDLDWYAVFNNNYLAHFTSGGTCAVPKKIRKSKINYDKLFDYFDNLDNHCKVDIIKSNLPDFTEPGAFLSRNLEERKKDYLHSFVGAATKGLFSYNIDFETNTYFLVAKPTTPLTLLELPMDVRHIIYKLPATIQPGALTISQIE